MEGGRDGGSRVEQYFKNYFCDFDIYIFNYLSLFIVNVCLMGGLIYELSLKKNTHTHTILSQQFYKG